MKCNVTLGSVLLLSVAPYKNYSRVTAIYLLENMSNKQVGTGCTLVIKKRIPALFPPSR